MKRSQVNDIRPAADEMIRAHGFSLPPFAHRSPSQFRDRADAAPQIIEPRCGRDITDDGHGDFAASGRALSTLRNGRLAHLQRGRGKCYAETLPISRRDRLSPMHTHTIRARDIIDRGDATLVVDLYGSDDADGFAGVRLTPDESVTPIPGDRHAAWAESGDMPTEEVSSINDVETDTIFRRPVGRFSDIEGDTDPHHLPVSDDARWLT